MTSLNKSLKPWLFGTWRLGGGSPVVPPTVLCGVEEGDPDDICIKPRILLPLYPEKQEENVLQVHSCNSLITSRTESRKFLTVYCTKLSSLHQKNCY